LNDKPSSWGKGGASPSQYILKDWDMKNLTSRNSIIETSEPDTIAPPVRLAVGADKYGQMEQQLSSKLST